MVIVSSTIGAKDSITLEDGSIQTRLSSQESAGGSGDEGVVPPPASRGSTVGGSTNEREEKERFHSGHTKPIVLSSGSHLPVHLHMNYSVVLADNPILLCKLY